MISGCKSIGEVETAVLTGEKDAVAMTMLRGALLLIFLGLVQISGPNSQDLLGHANRNCFVCSRAR